MSSGTDGPTSGSHENAGSDQQRMERALQLILALCDERITREEAEELDALVRADREVRQMYVRLMHLHAGLYQYAAGLGESGTAPPPDDTNDRDANGGSTMHETMVVPAVEDAASADDDEEQRALKPPELHRPPSDPPPVLPWPALIGAGIAAVLMVGLALAVYLRRAGNGAGDVARNDEPQHVVTSRPLAPKPQLPAPIPPPPPVAMLGPTVKPVWAPGGTPPADGKLPVGTRLSLASGCAQLNWLRGGDTILEAPCAIEIKSSGAVLLSSGRIVATAPVPGFVVTTPAGTMTDLGTKFGVAVDAEGGTEVAVFEGRVEAQLSATPIAPSSPTTRATTQVAGAPTTEPAKPLLLTAGKAAVMSRQEIHEDPAGAVPQRFVTRVSSRDVSKLDLVDLFCGGDGTTRRRGLAVDATTGAYGELAPAGWRPTEPRLHPISNMPVLDGALVPNGAGGSLAVDSAGHRFQFPATEGVSISNVVSGGSIPWYRPTPIRTILGGTDYAAAEHAILCIHSNNAITFDLDAIRRLYPGRSLAALRCLVGNSYVNGWGDETGADPKADVFVLVDGQNKFERRGFTNQDKAFEVRVPLDGAGRFLTLATTDGGDGINDDWVLWTDPQIELAP